MISRFPLNDLDYSLQRLDRIMSRRRLSFNPYTVSDERLMEIVRTTGWGNEWDITEFVTLHFTRLRKVTDYRKFDGIHLTVADSDEELFLPLCALIFPITANDSCKQERTWVGKSPIRNADDVEKLVGRTYFVSRIIRGVNSNLVGRCAYRLHRLKGNITKDAAMVREAMCAAKIEMLERILTYPESPCVLDCTKNFFNYESRIRRAIDLIKHFPDYPIP